MPSHLTTARVVASLVALLAACGEDPAPAPDPMAEDVPDDPAAEAADPPPAHVSSLSGTVTVEGAVASRGQAVDAEQVVEVREGGRATLVFEEGGHATLEEGSIGRVVTESAAQLFLIRGAAHAVQPPSGSSPRPPLRIVTSTATIDIPAAGEVYVAILEGGASFIAVLSGGASISNGEADARRRLRAVDLAAGQAMAVLTRLPEPTEGPRRLTDARQATRALATPATEPEAPRLARDVEAEAQRVDQALRWLETETRRGRELTTQHRDAVRQGQTQEADRLQRQLVGHSQAL